MRRLLLGLRRRAPLFGDRMCEPCLARTVLAKVPENIPWVRCAVAASLKLMEMGNIIRSRRLGRIAAPQFAVHERAEDIQLAMEPVKVSDRHTLLHIRGGVIDDLLFQEEHTMRARMANAVPQGTRRATTSSHRSIALQCKTTERRGIPRLRRTLDTFGQTDDPMFSSPTKALSPVVMMWFSAKAVGLGRHLTSEYGGMVVETTHRRQKTAGRHPPHACTGNPATRLGMVQWRHQLWRPAA